MSKILTMLAVVMIGCFMESICVIQGVRDIGFLSHVHRMRSFPCRKPQLRSIPVQELLQRPGSDELFYPSSTVLARCDRHSGCCLENQVCAIAEQEDVELVFIVNHVLDRQRAKHHEVITAKNHTRCHCVLGR
ncbi:uncharacterized protein LOC105690257 [Athalia rosae]|uniref:uncharacterized protein LOC105690257 n=1 Tax=Athalia rosae TaxID=37344 RepID=UPI0020332893|nr:uncharacterized protein LOC105690257 [Athalia rosae]